MSSLGAVSRSASRRQWFSGSTEKEVVMDSADVDIPPADGARVTASVSSPLSKSVTGTKRNRENVEECEDSVATKVRATASVGFKKRAQGQQQQHNQLK